MNKYVKPLYFSNLPGTFPNRIPLPQASASFRARFPRSQINPAIGVILPISGNLHGYQLGDTETKRFGWIYCIRILAVWIYQHVHFFPQRIRYLEMIQRFITFSFIVSDNNRNKFRYTAPFCRLILGYVTHCEPVRIHMDSMDHLAGIHSWFEPSKLSLSTIEKQPFVDDSPKPYLSTFYSPKP